MHCTSPVLIAHELLDFKMRILLESPDSDKIRILKIVTKSVTLSFRQNQNKSQLVFSTTDTTDTMALVKGHFGFCVYIAYHPAAHVIRIGLVRLSKKGILIEILKKN